MNKYNVENLADNLTKHTLSFGASSIEIIPEKGALLNSLKINHQQLLDHYNQIEDLQNLDWAKCALLFPFPNRLKDGKYSWENVPYQFQINLPPNAIHGFGLFEPFTVIDTEFNSYFSKISLSYIYNKKYSFYPFKFEVTISYILFENSLKVNYFAKNMDNHPIPMGLGWHPYFSIGGNVAEWYLRMPPTKKIEVDENMIPTGKIVKFSVFEKEKKIENTELDTCFKVEEKENFEMEIKNDKGILKYWQSVGNKKFNLVQLFIPPKRTCIAIEPMTCGIDAFNQDKNMVSLGVGEVLGGSFGVEWLEIKLN